MMKDYEILTTYPELDYVRQWTEAVERQQYESALSILIEGLELAKKRKSLPFIKHFRELSRVTKMHLAETSGRQKGKKAYLSQEKEEKAQCSFCGRKQKDVSVMVAGPGVFICDGCIKICSGIVAEKSASSSRQRKGEADKKGSRITKDRKKIRERDK